MAAGQPSASVSAHKLRQLLLLKKRVEQLAVRPTPATQSFAADPSDEERHTMQRQAYADTLRALALLPAPGCEPEPVGRPIGHVVEFGAGNGELSHALWLANGRASHAVLVDQRERRPQALHAAGGAREPAGGAGSLRRWEPLHVSSDVTTLRPEELRSATRRTSGCGDGGGCVALANHLCGDALDCAIRVAVEAWASTEGGAAAG